MIIGHADRVFAAAAENFADTTETLETLSNAQENLKAVAENPGLIRNWLEGLVPDILNFGFQVVLAIAIYVIGGKLIKWVLKLIGRSMDRAGADAGVRQFVTPLIKYTLYVMLIFMIMGLFGIATTSAVAVMGSAGVAIGLALQGSLSNLAGGVLILLLKPFVVGDYIIEDTNKNEGTVAEISIFYTKLLTVDNKVIVIPNGILSNSSLTNVTHMDKRRVDLIVGISYDADIRTAKEILKNLALEEPARLEGEEPVVYVDALGASSVDLGIRVWVNADDYWQAKWRLTENIKYAFEKSGISIPYQQIDVQIKQ